MVKIELKFKKFLDLQKRMSVVNFQVWGRSFCEKKSKNSETNLYDALGLNSSATPAEIKKAYYDLTFKHHPDRNKDNIEASTKFRQVTEAYEVLGNYGLRKRYDKGLPLPLSKRKIDPRQPIVEPKVQYQKFFDSRQAKSSPQIEEDVPNKAHEIFYERQRRLDEKHEKSKGVQTLMVVVLITFMVILKYYN